MNPWFYKPDLGIQIISVSGPYTSVRLPVLLYVCRPVYVSIIMHLFVCLSRTSVCLSVFLSVRRPVCVFIIGHISVYLSVCCPLYVLQWFIFLVYLYVYSLVSSLLRVDCVYSSRPDHGSTDPHVTSAFC